MASVHEAAWHHAYDGIIPHSSLNAMVSRRHFLWWEKAIRTGTGILVLDFDGDAVGYATFGRNRAPTLPPQGEIYELYLKPEYQGIGLGGRLFRAARHSLEKRRLDGLVVWALEENDPAREFYVRRGGHDAARGIERFGNRTLHKVAYLWP